MRKVEENKSFLMPNSRWLAYATAGAATALSAVATAEAEIHYSGLVNVVLPEGNPNERMQTHLPMSHQASIVFSNFAFATSDYNTARFRIQGAAVSHQFRAVDRIPRDAEQLPLQHPVLVSHGVFQHTHRRNSYGNIRSAYNDEWDSANGNGYIGFKFDSGAGPQYGWVRIRIEQNPSVGITIFDYAWGDPGDTIRTGQTNSADKAEEATPELGSLGLLAFGAAGLMAWRRRKAPTSLGQKSWHKDDQRPPRTRRGVNAGVVENREFAE